MDRRTLIDGKPLLLNVWATWCPTCRAEHQFLNGLAQQGVRVVGMNYKDDRQKAMSWLQRLGNPYRLSLYDGNGLLGLDLGVYGAPETFLIDGQRHYPLAARRRPERTGVARGAPAAVESIQDRGRADERRVERHPAGADADRPDVGRHRYVSSLKMKPRSREREITSQLRCPKCQNNSIADSNAMIAADMRQKV